ncbi:RidA family protein [Tomitella fengzijianii]|uniref:RidA family protein n=1 Tax=Tomitella fengzijianii TaxID=2597660 RepID=A0A516X1S8_9ACTN|nr:RidA family protein [Tomitella fengzijianii]QDQ97042.1 RidA family protein [Tomitella fengzijianii]
MTPHDGPGGRTPDPHPYSPAFAAGGFAFVSGALSVDPEGTAVPGRVEALEAAIARMTERLATVGGRLEHVVKLTYFVTDVTLRDEANRQFEQVFSHPRPARTFLEVSALPYGATVEIDCIALLADA